MNSSNKLITIGDDITIEVCRLSVKKQLERNALIRKFLPELPKDAAAEAIDLRTMRWNLIAFSGQTVATEGLDVELAHSSDEPEEFERKFDLFLNLDSEVMREWLAGIDGISKPLVPRSQLPESMLTEDEKADPKQNANAPRLSAKSAKSSSTALRVS